MSLHEYLPSEVYRLLEDARAAPDGTHLRLAPGDFTLPKSIVVRAAVSIHGEPGKTRLLASSCRHLLTEKKNVTVEVTGLIFEGGSEADGAAIHPQSKSTLLVDRCRFIRNKGGDLGGAIFLGDANGSKISRCIFEENEAVEGGGAIAVASGSDVTIDRCIFRANRSKVGGGIILSAGGAMQLRHCTFVDNEASWPKGGGAVFVFGAQSFGASGLVANSVFRGREAICADPSKQYKMFFRNSVVPADLFGQERFENVAGNTLAPPDLVSLGDGCFALAANSPGTGTADPKFTTADSVDWLGRRFRAPSDPGAFVRAS